ncbi:formiminotransferase N-terminal subdomain-containing protein isoform X3 [Hyla sarda]|uniref:formiminotransferase N-terminal subdomain-containing protein isoform X3 n=1 Tax=Hyla sarda TaxID=327740 RepID=UPI0024C3CA3F|nr:formiminotransferase N-terminal subdomain-containing protein isoform X3 [Hyla sarda]
MTSSKFGKSLVACLLNVSEARNKDNIERIARAALFNIRGQKHPDTAVLNVFSNYDYNRSVLTIVSTSEWIGIAEELVTQVPGCSMFLFGYADIAEMRSLADKRRSLGWFRKNCNVDEIKADVGMKPCGKYGITGVGASPYVMNCNITLDTQDLTSGKAIATAIRERTGGLKGVQAMAFPNKGQVEIACNVESFRDIPENISAADVDKYVSYHICGDTFSYISLHHIEAKVQNLAACKGIKTTGTALVGFTPQECRVTAEYAISHGIGEFWKRRQGVFM